MARTVSTANLDVALRIKPGAKVHLASIDANETYGHEKSAAVAAEAALEARLTSLQERIFAEGKHPILIVLQGIDAAGKDGTIRKVMDAFNPMGCTVTGFKVPTPLELSHDFLWRVHPHAPEKGSIAIFNRSHYEDVLVVRVHEFVPEAVWRRRYGHINDFEQLLTDEGTTMIKFFLYIDQDEQKRRLEARRDDPTKNWKFKAADLAERALWDHYIEAFEECLERTSTPNAPWYLIPANRKWFRNLAVSRIVAETLDRLHPEYPPPEPGSKDLVVE